MHKLVAAILALGLAGAGTPSVAETDWSKVDQLFGRAGANQAGVHRYGLARTDLQVTLDGVTIRPTLALGSWVAFSPMGDMAMVMGDLVLTSEEVNPVMKKLVEGGIAITAVHNHLLRSSPTTLYMHIGGKGDPVKLAGVIRAALELSATPLTPAPAAPAQDLGIDTAQIDQIIGQKGTVAGGVYQVGVPRAENIVEDGMAVPPAMGSAVAINFQPTGGGKAAITGDFVLIGSEVNPVLATLRARGIEVTALHSHMLTEQPRLLFMHFWANDDALKLARTLRAALDLMNVKRG